MQKRIIVLNGAPNSGKDAIAASICNGGGFVRQEVKKVLFDQVLALSQINESDWFNRYNDRELKEQPWSRLGGLSCREFMIKVSEEYVKPVFGKDFYGKRAAEIAGEHKYNVVFSDCGFSEEFSELANKFGDKNVLLVRLHRDGCSFDNDSRSHLSHPKQEIDITNEENLMEWAVLKIIKHAEKIWGNQF